MKRPLIALCIALFALPTAVNAGDPPELAPPFDMGSIEPGSMMQRFQEAMTPAENHEMLAWLEGEWDTVTRMWMQGPDTAPLESKGGAINEFDFGGRFLRSRAQTTMMGMPTDGEILIGYDNFAKKYQMTSMSTLGTAMHHASGYASMDGTEIIFYGQMDEAGMGIHGRTVMYLFKATGPDTYTMEVHDLHIGRTGTKVVETEFKRKG